MLVEQFPEFVGADLRHFHSGDGPDAVIHLAEHAGVEVADIARRKKETICRRPSARPCSGSPTRRG
jgi:hypothetical protein